MILCHEGNMNAPNWVCENPAEYVASDKYGVVIVCNRCVRYYKGSEIKNIDDIKVDMTMREMWEWAGVERRYM